MAYVSQEMKAEISPVIKSLLKQYGLKGSLRVRNHSTLVLTVSGGKIDFLKNFNENMEKMHVYNFGENRAIPPAKEYINVNVYHAEKHFSGKAKDFIMKAVSALKGSKYYDHSDPQTDYFNCSHYVDIDIGRWDKPYVLEG